MPYSAWTLSKKYFTDRLHNEMKLGLVDQDIVDFLLYINRLEDFYTTSSCSGRIAIGVGETLSNKKAFRIVYKWHTPISTHELEEATSELEPQGVTAWLLVRQPIIHIAVKSMDLALKVLHLAREAEFESSNILTIDDYRIVVEVVSQERFDTLLMRGGKLLYSRQKLSYLVNLANTVLVRGKTKLSRFEQMFREVFREVTW